MCANPNLIYYDRFVFCSIPRLFVCICVCEFLRQYNIARVPSSRATFGFPQYCAFTYVRFGCTQHASCVDTKPKKEIVSTDLR